MQKPVLYKATFWDVDFENIDYDKYASFVIKRVFDRGTWNDVTQVVSFYGRDKVKEVLLNADYLMLPAFKTSRLLFNLMPEQFKCYEKKQFRPNF